MHRILISNKRIQKFLMNKEQPFWIYYKFGKHEYIMDFDYNVWRKK